MALHYPTNDPSQIEGRLSLRIDNPEQLAPFKCFSLFYYPFVEAMGKTSFNINILVANKGKLLTNEFHCTI